MTRKHFEAIAAALNRRYNQPDQSGLEHIVVDEIIQDLANVFVPFNSGFDRAKFIEACTKPPNPK